MDSHKPKNEPKGTYTVGYCRPPKESQFKPGQSGNPKGARAKRAPVDVAEILREPVAVNQNGKLRHMSSFELGLRRLAAEAAKGRSVKHILEFIAICERYGVVVPPPPLPAGGGVLELPKGMKVAEGLAMLKRYGLPPWPEKDQRQEAPSDG